MYTAIGDYPNALASHKQCVQLVKQMGDRLQEAREIGNVGAVYLAMGEFDSAVDCHTQHLRLARRLGDQVYIYYWSIFWLFFCICRKEKYFCSYYDNVTLLSLNNEVEQNPGMGKINDDYK